MTRKCLRHIVLFKSGVVHSRSQWPRSLAHVSAAARLLGLRIRILPGVWLCDSCECCVFFRKRSLSQADHSSRGVISNVLCQGLIVKPW